jgi:XRE family transcriptional regulator, regulator of sulfur utilization
VDRKGGRLQDGNIPDIGPVIQQRRKENSLTLEQLAAISGVSKSMLSQIERGETNPTFAVLWALTRALRIEFSELLQGSTAPADANAIELVPLLGTPEIRSGDGMCRLRILSPPRLAGRTEWYDIEIQPGGRLDSAAHAAGTIEHFTAVTSGFEISSGGALRSLRAGETARYPVDVPHCIANNSRHAARGFLVVLFKSTR